MKVPSLSLSSAQETKEELAVDVRKGFALAPPHPMEKAPHQDLGELGYDVIGDLQGVGEKINEVLDKPLDVIGVKFEGPHRLIGHILDIPSGLARNFLKDVSNF